MQNRRKNLGEILRLYVSESNIVTKSVYRDIKNKRLKRALKELEV